MAENTNNTEDFATEKWVPVVWTIVIAIFVCLLLWVGLSAAQWYADGHFEISEAGTASGNKYALFGDSFGAVNALVSALAFAGMIVAIFMQRSELQLQRKDLKLQRDEFATQNETLKLQRFENTFFNMLSLQQEIVNNLYFKGKEKGPDPQPDPDDEELIERTIEGRELFRFAFASAIHYSNAVPSKRDGFIGYLQKVGLLHYSRSNTPSYFDHYFRHLYTIVKFVHNSGFSFEEQYKYTTMIRATLSRYELVWLYYNCLSDVGREKFKGLVEEYSLLKNIREDLLGICKENRDDMQVRKITITMLRDAGFSCTDYEFFLTTEQNDPDKYHISAFYNKSELKRGEQECCRWNEFLERHPKQP